MRALCMFIFMLIIGARKVSAAEVEIGRPMPRVIWVAYCVVVPALSAATVIFL
jgi:hypothetical protein